jgi:SPP1 gp7 family putative phage head morphogenesis protein
LIDEAGTREDGVRHDDWGRRLRDLFNAVRSSVQPVIGRTQQAMRSLGDEVPERVTDELIRAIRATMGVRPSFYDDDRVRGILNAWKDHNEAFITRMSEDAVQDMMDVASRGVRQGRSTKEVRDELRKRFGVNDRRARTIARTEISQLNAQVTQSRQRELGIDGYIWRTAGDERVRDEHDEMEGVRVEWDSPPSLTGGNHAGESVNCRCSSSADISSLLDQLEAE